MFSVRAFKENALKPVFCIILIEPHLWDNVIRCRPLGFSQQIERRQMTTINQAVELYKDHQRTTLKARTRESYRLLLEKFQESFSDREVDSIKSEEILQFLETVADKMARSSRHLRYSQLKAFFSFALDLAGLNIQNP